MGDGAKVIRSLLVRLGVKTDDKALKAYDKALDDVKSTMQGAAKVALALKVALVGAATGIAMAASGAADHAEMLTQTADTLGLTTDALQEYRHVFDQFPMGIDGVEKAFAKLNRSGQEALRGSDVQVKAWGALGVKLDELKGKDPGALFERLADAAAATHDPVKRLDALTSIFGDEMATKVAPALAGGAAGIRALREQARAYGLVMDKDLIARGNAAKGQFQLLRGVISAVRLEIGLHLIPVVLEVVNGILGWVRANRELLSQRIERAIEILTKRLRELRELLRRLDTLVQDVFGGWDKVLMGIAGGAGMFALLRALKGLATIITFIKALVTALAVAAGIGFSPMLLIVAGVVAWFVALGLAVDELLTYFRGGDSMLGRFIDRFSEMEGVLGSTARFLRAWLELGRTVFGLIGQGASMVASAVAEFAAWAAQSEIVQAGLQAVGEALEFWVLGPISDAIDLITELVEAFTLLLAGDTTGALKSLTEGVGAIGRRNAERFAEPAAMVAGGLRGIASSVANNVDQSRTAVSNTVQHSFAPVVNVYGGAASVGSEVEGLLRRSQSAVLGGDR